MYITEHFTLEELTVSQTAAREDINNEPTGIVMDNLIRLASFLEEVRTLLGGKPMLISSGYRSPELNARVGGSAKSQHCFGCAVDFTVNKMAVEQVVATIVTSKLNYDQCIQEYNRWIHLSIPSSISSKPRRMALIIDRKGTRSFA